MLLGFTALVAESSEPNALRVDATVHFLSPGELFFRIHPISDPLSSKRF